MSLGPLMVDIEGTELTPADREILSHPLVNGVILFSRNYETTGQLTRLVQDIHSVRDPRLIVSVDHEGGPVQRFRDGFTHLPAAAQLGNLYRSDSQQALKLSRDTGWLMAIELRACGLDLSFAPVIDIEHNGSQVLRYRTYHDDPQVVAELAHQFMLGMQAAGMQATGKHFPGHGGVSGDSHQELPVDDRSYDDIYSRDILPFERMIHYGLAAIMPAHVIYPRVDSRPAGFSPVWIGEVLRRRLEFNGTIFSDDLSMAGAEYAGGYTERAEAALDAGCDILLICNNREGVEQVLDNLRIGAMPVLQTRIARLHGKTVDELSNFKSSQRWQRTASAIKLLYDEFPLEQELDLA